jgi:hypothetical protein
MSYPPSHYAFDSESSESYPDYETAEEAWRAERRRRTYLPAVFVALAFWLLPCVLGLGCAQVLRWTDTIWLATAGGFWPGVINRIGMYSE